jgi:hypothetical protein
MGRIATKILGGLFGDRKHGEWVVSKGSVAFWLLLGNCLWNWQHGIPVPDMEVYSMWGMIGYSGYKLLAVSKADKPQLPAENS